MIAANVDYRLYSSVKVEPPEDIPGSPTRAIHAELYTDIFMSEMFLEITVSAQIVLSGLIIDTKKNKALQSFVVRYERRSIQYSGVMEDIMVYKLLHLIQIIRLH